MAYYHIDETQQYIQTLGLDPINAESQNVVANAIPDDNSFYSPNRDEIQTGTGGVDDGEDADVIVHEYGHSVQDAQNPTAFGGGCGFDPAGAMGEGFGDYLSQACSTETVGFDDEWSHCVMEWDATSYDNNNIPPPGICLRRTDNDDGLLDAETVECGGEVHCVGEVWGSALCSTSARSLATTARTARSWTASPWPHTSCCRPRLPSSRPRRRCSRPTRTCTRPARPTTARAITATRSRTRWSPATCC